MTIPVDAVISFDWILFAQFAPETQNIFKYLMPKQNEFVNPQTQLVATARKLSNAASTNEENKTK